MTLEKKNYAPLSDWDWGPTIASCSSTDVLLTPRSERVKGKLNFYSEVELNQLIDVTDRNPCCDFALQA